MGTDILQIWEKTGTYKDIQDAEEGDILILADGMVLKVECNKKFTLKIKCKVLQKRKPKHDQKIMMASTPHPNGQFSTLFDGFAEYLESVPMTGEWTYEYLVKRGAKQAGEVAKKLYE